MIYKLVFLLISFFLVSCDKPNPNPQDSDPIYLDIKAKVSNLDARKLSASAILKELEGRNADAEPQSGQPKYFRAKIQEANLTIEKIDQELRYQKMQLQNRETFVKKKYFSAFSRGEQWSNKNEVEAYKNAEKWSRDIASIHRSTKRTPPNQKGTNEVEHGKTEGN